MNREQILEKLNSLIPFNLDFMEVYPNVYQLQVLYKPDSKTKILKTYNYDTVSLIQSDFLGVMCIKAQSLIHECIIDFYGSKYFVTRKNRRKLINKYKEQIET